MTSLSAAAGCKRAYSVCNLIFALYLTASNKYGRHFEVLADRNSAGGRLYLALPCQTSLWSVKRSPEGKSTLSALESAKTAIAGLPAFSTLRGGDPRHRDRRRASPRHHAEKRNPDRREAIGVSVQQSATLVHKAALWLHVRDALQTRSAGLSLDGTTSVAPSRNREY